MSETGISAGRSEQIVGSNGAPPRLDAVHGGVVPIEMPQSAPGRPRLTASDSHRFLRIVSQASRLCRHSELFQFLQGDIQSFLPHQILISASGDFRGSNLTTDVISSLPGVRTRELLDCELDPALRRLQVRWAARGRQPLLLERAAIDRLLRPGCDCVLRRYLPQMHWALAHGCHDARDGSDSLYLALSSKSIINGRSIERFRLLADPLFSQIDIAFRRIAAPERSSVLAHQALPPTVRVLSAREEEIFQCVSEGKTNVDIARILAISTFTVKNHVQRIMKKLDAANRTEAVAKYRQMRLQPQASDSAREAA